MSAPVFRKVVGRVVQCNYAGFCWCLKTRGRSVEGDRELGVQGECVCVKGGVWMVEARAEVQTHEGGRRIEGDFR